MGLWRSQCDLHTTTIADLSSTQQYTCYFINMWEDRVCMYVVRARSFAQLLCIWYRLCVRVSGVANCNFFLNVFFPSLSRSLRHCINLMFLCMSQWFGFMLGRFQYSIMIIKSEFQFITWPKKKWQANMKICSVISINWQYDKFRWLISRLWKVLNDPPTRNFNISRKFCYYLHILFSF